MPGYESLPGSHGNFMVRVLGGFTLFWEDSVLRVPRASQRLLAFLALQSRMVTRAAIAGTLWPEASESRASANLRSALARLQGTARKALAADKLELGLAEGIAVDVRDAQGLARRLLDPAVTPDRAELGMATVLVLSADLLPDWYDDWVQLEAEDWRQLRLHALEALAVRLIALGRWGEAANAAGAAVRAEPLRESARAALIRAHLAEGNQSEAVREFTRYRTLLDAELGLAPTPRLHELLASLHGPTRCDHCHGVTIGT
jgi:DNA-binding SARP family transcriptional activator